MVLCNKIKALNLFLLISFLFVPLTCAASNSASDPAAEGNLYTELKGNADLYNEHFEKVPEIVKRLVGSEEIKGEIELENGEMLYVTLRMAGGKVDEFYKYDTSEDPNSKFGPSMTVKTNEETIRIILDSDDPLKATANGMNDGTFNVEAKGFFRKAMVFTFKNYVNNLT